MSQGKIVVTLVRDHKGRLIGIREFDIIHYSIQLSVQDLPEMPEKVIYHLHESYASPKITVKAGVPNFLTEITSYGDYDLKVEVHYSDRIDSLETTLYEGLFETYQKDEALEIKQALEQIKRL